MKCVRRDHDARFPVEKIVMQQQQQETTEALSDKEFHDLCRLEAVVSRGIEAYKEVGEALLEILEKRLYRATHRSFDLYCRERWKFAKSRAYQLIQASVVAGELASAVSTIGGRGGLPTPENERQARALAEAPADQRIGIWKAGVELSGGTAPPASRVAQLLEKARRGVAPEALAEAVRQEEAAVRQDGDHLTREAGKEDLQWRVARGLWHLKQARRFFVGYGGDCDRAVAAIDQASQCVLEDVGPVEPMA